jgi:DNA-binding transcriptional ArsR family regulator
MSQRSSAAALKLTAAAPLFAALGDATRLKLVNRLSVEGPLSITRLRRGSRVTRQAITKHLRALADAGVVEDHRVGRERIWQLETRRLADARRYLDEVSAQWDAAVGRLQAYLEKNS